MTSTRRTDLTDRLATEAALRRSQHMRSLGRFAGGIAHDVNNVLSAIAGFAELLAEELPEDAVSARDDAGQIREIASGGRRLTARLLDVAHSRPVVPGEVDVASGLRDLEPSLARSLSDTCALRLDVEDVPPVVLGEGQLDQVVANLVSNAADAMPDGGTGLGLSTVDAIVRGAGGHRVVVIPRPNVASQVRTATRRALGRVDGAG